VRASPALRAASPLLAVTFVNKMASIALSLLPALLVEREAGVALAAATLGISRTGGIVGNLLSGPIADRYGLKPTLVGAMGMAAVGVAAMAYPGPLGILVFGAFVAQVGLGMFPSAVRLMLVAMVPLEFQREALAWQRSTANLGLVASFTLGALLGGHFVAVLLLLDAAASFVAAGLAWRLLPSAQVASAPWARGSGPVVWLPFVWTTAILGWWNLVYELYFTSSAAQLRLVLGPAGVSWFSAVMLLNVIGCAVLGVVVARWIDRPQVSVPAGFLLLTAGAALGVAFPSQLVCVAAGMALATAGELVYVATIQFVWMSLVPDVPRRATVFSVAMTATFVMRAIGGALAFPLIVESAHPATTMLILGVPGVLAALVAAPVWRAFDAVTGVR
jgi:predicted MFS family arabinose efflux permease